MSNYKIAIIGFGSIGKRHFKNMCKILKMGNKNYSIDLIRSKESSELEENDKVEISNIYRMDDNIPKDYDIIFITNPTHLHYETFLKFKEHTRHMFIEKPVFHDVFNELNHKSFKNHGIYYVACPLRYTNVIQYIKHNIDLEKVYSVRAICSSYLPDWRPDVDYRNTYSAHVKQGGGVSIDLIHEWDYIIYLFGLPNRVENFRGTFSHLEIDSDDLSIYMGQYEKRLVEVHLDYFGREPIREIQLFTPKETIVGDLIKSEVRFLKSGKKISFGETRNDFQLEEMKYFFDLIEERLENHNDIEQAITTLSLVKKGKI